MELWILLDSPALSKALSDTRRMNERKGSLVIITGASRGIGRAIALAIAESIKESSTQGDDDQPQPSMLSAPLRMVLIARSTEPLLETACLVEQRCVEDSMASCHEMNLSDLDALPDKLQHMLQTLSSTQYDSCWLINNAGSLGPLGPASSMPSMKELRSAIDLNITSSIWLSSQFTKTFLTSSSSEKETKSPLVRIINISSLCAIEPFPTMSTYCAGKAGIDMFHSVLAKEHSFNKADEDEQKRKQNFKVLNYAPGPCDTQMTDDLAECSVLDEGLHSYYATSKQENKLVRPEDTAKKLVHLLCMDEFESGSHVDYFDV